MLTGGLLFQHRIFNMLQNSLERVYPGVLFISWQIGFPNVGITCSYTPCFGLERYSVTSNIDELEPSCKFATLAVLGIGVQIRVPGHPIYSSVPHWHWGIENVTYCQFFTFFPFSHYFPVQPGNCCVLHLGSVISAVCGHISSGFFSPHM